MTLSLLDWSAIAGYLAITILLGFWFRKRSSRNVDEYFVGGRTVSWWLAGTSMVATTFAADTPLLVAGLVYTQGISGNWIWWAFLPSGMMTVFLFARLWRRSGLMTDVQFAEMRYSGKPAAFLRGFRAIYLGRADELPDPGLGDEGDDQYRGHDAGRHHQPVAFLAEHVGKPQRILARFFPAATDTRLIICIFFLIPFTGFYVSLGGLSGVLWTDLFQFILKMGIVIAIAWYAVKAAGGMSSMISQIAALRRQERRLRPAGVSSRFFARLRQRDAVDFAGITVLRVPRRAVVGLLVSGSGTRRRRIHRAADFQRARRAPRFALRVCGSTWRTTRCVPGPGFSPRSAAIVLYPGPGASGDQLHADGQSIMCRTRCAASLSRDFWRRSCPRSRRN